ncbi:hypothetical protein ACN2EN_02745 [Aliarcobacter lanthieri]|uniref:hypothetical protein n=1 Tax=Aliarcobacter lanthieri TaxID=1355374 RepID=UPI0004AE739F|nr:hypothetical protein [Aliarcobacter lanthieri]QKF58578.1 hypothetical protein ALANTH_0447 [Aliarcobacter lanthieri]
MKEISIFKVLVPIILLILILIGVLLYNILKTPEEATIQQIKEPSSIKDRRDALKDAFK